MSMMERLTKGGASKPPIGVIYGEPGIGKTTLAAQLPGPIFVQTEDGLTSPSLSNTPTFGLLRTFDEVMQVLKAIAENREQQGWQTIVIDSLEGLDPIIKKQVCEKNNWKQIEDGSYGAGKAAYVQEWTTMMQTLIRVREHTGMGILMLGHTKTTQVTPPDGDAYNRFGLTLHPDVERALIGNSDFVLFARKERQTLQEDQGFGRKVGKVLGVKDAVMFTETAGAYEAKNRYGMPTPSIPMRWDALAQYIPAWAPYVPKQQAAE